MCGKKVNQETTSTMNGSSPQTTPQQRLVAVVPDAMASSTTTVKNSWHENERKRVLRKRVLSIIDDVLDVISDDSL
jgi:uncharacterized protein YkwD